MKVYQQIASCLQAMANCRKSGNDEWLQKHADTIAGLVRNKLPSGSGWDNGTKLDLDASTPEKLVFDGAFHHMNDGGYYDGWTEHRITVTPSLVFGIDIKISGCDRNDIKEYLHEIFHGSLTEESSNEDALAL
jgi:hypothetical protein